MNVAYDFRVIEEGFPLKNENIIYQKHPVVYLLHNDKKLYIGETTNLRRRFEVHQNTKAEHKFNQSKIVFSNYFNKSAIYDIETQLIKYFHVDAKYELVNTKTSQSSHLYYKKEKYAEVFKNLWNELKNKELVTRDISDIENDLLFKYSPFTAFSDEQLAISELITKGIKTKSESKSIISGDPGTGKTLVAIKMLYDLFHDENQANSNIKIGFCVPQSSVRKTFKKLLRMLKIKVDVISGSKLTNKYDVLIVDEAHRLKSYFGKQAKDLKHLIKGNGEHTTELELAIKNSKHLILMYDSAQSIRPADVDMNYLFDLPEYFQRFFLKEQFRVQAGSNYTKFIKGLLQINEGSDDFSFGDYEFEILDSIKELHCKILDKDRQYDLSRMSSGYYVKWKSKSGNSSEYDFVEKIGESEEYKINWNSTVEDWVGSLNAVNEVGCIHTLQGVDLNYCGVIIGNDIYLDPEDNKIKINANNYHDRNGMPLKDDDEFEEKLEKYIKNIYYVLLTRGIRGTYLYIENQPLKEYIMRMVDSSK